MMRTLALAVGVCLLTGASSAATNGDDEGPDPTPPSAVLVQDELLLDTDAARTEAEALAEAWGVPVDTAHRWRQTQFALDDAAVAAESAAGGRYAGAWIEWRPEPHLVVELTHGRQVAAIATAFRNVGSNAEVRYADGPRSALVARRLRH